MNESRNHILTLKIKNSKKNSSKNGSTAHLKIYRETLFAESKFQNVLFQKNTKNDLEKSITSGSITYLTLGDSSTLSRKMKLLF